VRRLESDRALGPTVRGPPSYRSMFESVCRKCGATRRPIANTRSQALRGCASVNPRKPGSPIEELTVHDGRDLRRARLAVEKRQLTTTEPGWNQSIDLTLRPTTIDVTSRTPDSTKHSARSTAFCPTRHIAARDLDVQAPSTKQGAGGRRGRCVRHVGRGDPA
jgi:hypothetical protein